MAAKTVDGIAFSGKNLIGLKFGRLTVLRLAFIRHYTTCKIPMWECACECGNTRAVDGRKLASGWTKSCGCYHVEAASAANTTHGFTRNLEAPPIYTSWQHMKRRCYDPKSEFWHRYGGRGIRVCERWRNSFAEFASDMNESWKPKLKIDRKDNDGNYSCGKCDDCKSNNWTANCKWSTDSEQARNRSSNRLIEINRVKKPLYYWLENSGVPRDAFYRRIKNGWDEATAATARFIKESK